jgi:hypothetical protein
MKSKKTLEKEVSNLIKKYERETGMLATDIKLDIVERKGRKSLLGCYINVINNKGN